MRMLKRAAVGIAAGFAVAASLHATEPSAGPAPPTVAVAIEGNDVYVSMSRSGPSLIDAANLGNVSDSLKENSFAFRALQQGIETFLAEKLRKAGLSVVAADALHRYRIEGSYWGVESNPTGGMLFVDVQLIEARSGRFLSGQTFGPPLEEKPRFLWKSVWEGRQAGLLAHFGELVQSWIAKDASPLAAAVRPSLSGANPEFASELADACASIKGEAAVGILGNLVPVDSYEAILALGKIDSPEASRVLVSAADRKDNYQDNAVEALGGHSDPAGVDLLLVSLSDPGVEVRVAAIRALGSRKEIKAFEPVMAMLADSNDRVREAAASALPDLGDASALKSAVPRIKARFEQEPKGGIRSWLAASLCIAGQRDAIASILEGAASSDGWAALAALRLLVDRGYQDPGITPVFLSAMKATHSKYVRMQGYRGLGSVLSGKPANRQEIVGALVSALETETEADASRWIISSLGESRSRSAIDPIVKAVNASSIITSVVHGAAALAKIGDPASEKVLRAWFEHHRRTDARRALQDALDELARKAKAAETNKAAPKPKTQPKKKPPSR